LQIALAVRNSNFGCSEVGTYEGWAESGWVEVLQERHSLANHNNLNAVLLLISECFKDDAVAVAVAVAVAGWLWPRSCDATGL
jgi:hypothetical protein